MQQKCIYAANNIKKGKKIEIDDLIIKGPGGGILPKYIDIILGREVKNDIKKDMVIHWEDV